MKKHVTRIIYFSIAVFLLNFFYGCKQEKPDSYTEEILDWHKKRIENLTKKDGWLSLVGLYWLKEGENKFGSDKSNDIVFPANAPAFIGTFILEDGGVTAKMNPGIGIYVDTMLVEKIKMKDDQTENPTILRLGTLSWYVIKRTIGLGIRVKDSENHLIKDFKGIETYPVDIKWRLAAQFIPYDPPRIITVPDILGTVEDTPSPGALSFFINDKQFTLDVIDAGRQFYIIFGDITNGKETYGAGRFLYVDKPDSSNITTIDFNKAYNPPCAFTKFATCPLPPKQNLLRAEIKAGEKKYEGAGH